MIDHSLESSCGALSGGTIGFLIQPFSGGKYILRCYFLSQNTSVLKEINALRRKHDILYIQILYDLKPKIHASTK
jgi:hypothetical protein